MSEPKNKNVSFLLHMYQPPWQYKDMLETISNECYLWLTKWFSEQKGFKATINLNYSLTELLIDNGLNKIIDNIGAGLENGSIELTGTAAYHPILPLIPKDEIKRQIALNYKKHGEIFGNLWKPKGFFPPEMAVSPDLVRIVRSFGYEWMITEDIVNDMDRRISDNSIVTVDDFSIFFRNSDWSNKFAMEYPNRGKTNAEEFIQQLLSQMISK